MRMSDTYRQQQTQKFKENTKQEKPLKHYLTECENLNP